MVNAEKLKESRLCPSCGAEVVPTSGPGRPLIYCCETCRRLAEFRLRSLSKRIDANELALRDAQSPSGWPDNSRQERIRELKRWLKLDRGEFRELLAGNNRKTPAK